MEETRQLYLDLIKRCLTNWIYGDTEQAGLSMRRPMNRLLAKAAGAAGLRLARPRPFDPAKRADGSDWPPTAHTMIGLKRLDNLQFCIEDVLNGGVPGDLIETGAWRGGASIFMRAVLKAYGVSDRLVWVADSFQGLPRPDAAKFPADAGDNHFVFDELAVSLEQVRTHFDRYGLLDDRVRFLKGWFKDTLPGAPIQRLAVIRLDGDMYESTMDALIPLYPKLSPGGYLIIDDLALPGCRQAVEDYRKARGITDEIVTVDWTGAYWRKTG
ncbi:MAG: class I SAM-dependent methyltransferase [Armatimonadetes bacterium]|nr:class I SAM-dependent methyltransferase [Armatimonadota bacterium]